MKYHYVFYYAKLMDKYYFDSKTNWSKYYNKSFNNYIRDYANKLAHSIKDVLSNNKLFSWSPRALAAVDDTF